MEEQIRKKRVREDSEESEAGSGMPEMKKIKEDLLDLLDDSDLDQATQDLDSVMKSFQEEISASPVPVVDLTSDSGESQPDLGYLLEASDDELGLPPSSINSRNDEDKNGVAELVRVDSGESVGVGGLWGFEDQMPSYDSFEELSGVVGGYNSEYVAEFDDGLFEYSNVCFDSSEFSDYSWRLGTMPAD